ncbi:MAG: DNA polymerase IV [Dehalococcoidia bacterium]|nr:DNA polymerase IV [Dehalococcoidia bacterium]
MVDRSLKLGYNGAVGGTIPRYVLHADLDAFYASVEQRDNPELKGKPVVVGGSPEGRGVVAAASYEARTYGVRSAMPMRTAFRLCPHLVRVSARFPRYHEVSRQIMSIFRDLTPLVQPLSLDEAYMDIGRVESMEHAEDTARELKERVRRETLLAVTIGGGTSKTVAKIASQMAKPDGLLMVEAGAEQEFLHPLDAGSLWGVGPKTAQMLKRNGIVTIGDIAGSDDDWLRRTFGKRGPELKERAQGLDNEDVSTHRGTKSVSAETTMAEDIGDEETLVEIASRLGHGVAQRIRRNGLQGKTVSVKLRLSDFTTFTRQITLPAPTADEDIIARESCALLRREIKPGRKFRLVGVGVSNFQEDYQLALWS